MAKGERRQKGLKAAPALAAPMVRLGPAWLQHGDGVTRVGNLVGQKETMLEHCGGDANGRLWAVDTASSTLSCVFQASPAT